MPKLDKGKVFLRCSVHALTVFLKEIPGVGIPIELGQGWFNIIQEEYRKASVKERIKQLEEAALISPSEARAIADEIIEEQRAAGELIPEDRAEVIRELLTFMPATIREKTRATLRQAQRHGTALQTVFPVSDEANPFDQETFYRSLFPTHRPRFRSGDPVPHGLDGWYLGELLGVGGFGEVWEVRHERLRHAIKFFLDEGSANILKREAAALFDVHEKLPRHTNIVQLIDLNLDKSPYWLRFEYVEGGTLESLLRATSLSWQESLALFRPIVEGVAAVHRIGIVHRDLKPANILLTAENEPKITDFGIGKVIAENEAVMRTVGAQFTTQGFGSVGYMSREQREGLSAHPTDDTYALGVLLWQMLTHNVKTPDLQALTELQQLDAPEALKHIVSKCLTKPREERPQDADALLKMLPAKPRSAEVSKDANVSEKSEAEKLEELRESIKQKWQRGDDNSQSFQETMKELQNIETLLGKVNAYHNRWKQLKDSNDSHNLQQAGNVLQETFVVLDEIKPESRTRFETLEDYNQRLILAYEQQLKPVLGVLQERIDTILKKQFDVSPAQLELILRDYEPYKELMDFQVIAEEFVEGQRYCTQNAQVEVSKETAKTCWERWKKDKSLLLPCLSLSLETGAKPKVTETGFETVEGQRYCNSADLRIEISEKAQAEIKKQREEAEQREQEKKLRFEREKLKIWNPFDRLKLLWWVLVTPQKLHDYKDIYGEPAKENVNEIDAKLAIFLPWFILVLSAFAVGMGFLPLNENALKPHIYLIITGVFIAYWLLGEIFSGDIGDIGDVFDPSHEDLLDNSIVVLFLVFCFFGTTGVLLFFSSNTPSNTPLIEKIFFSIFIGAIATFGLFVSIAAVFVFVRIFLSVLVFMMGGWLILFVATIYLLGNSVVVAIVLGITASINFYTMVIADNVSRSEEHPNLFKSRTIFTLFILSNSLLIWFLYFGGWQVFS